MLITLSNGGFLLENASRAEGATSNPALTTTRLERAMADQPIIKAGSAGKRQPRSQPFFLLLTLREARHLRLTRFFTGIPCNHGHLSERMVSDSHCIECKRVKARLRPPPSSIKEVRRERYRARRQAHYQKHRERIIKRVVQRARHRLDHDPVFRLRHTIRGRISNVLRKNGKPGSAIKLLGCTVPEAKAHIESQFQPGMSWANWGEWHIDHIRPLAAFDLSDPEQLAEACHFTNLQPLWAVENMRKGARFAA